MQKAKPIGPINGIFTYISHKNQPNVGKYTIRGSYGNCLLLSMSHPGCLMTGPLFHGFRHNPHINGQHNPVYDPKQPFGPFFCFSIGIVTGFCPVLQEFWGSKTPALSM